MSPLTEQLYAILALVDGTLFTPVSPVVVQRNSQPYRKGLGIVPWFQNKNLLHPEIQRQKEFQVISENSDFFVIVENWVEPHVQNMTAYHKGEISVRSLLFEVTVLSAWKKIQHHQEKQAEAFRFINQQQLLLADKEVSDRTSSCISVDVVQLIRKHQLDMRRSTFGDVYIRLAAKEWNRQDNVNQAAAWSYFRDVECGVVSATFLNVTYRRNEEAALHFLQECKRVAFAKVQLHSSQS